MAGPHDEQELSSRDDSFTMYGLAWQPGATVEIKAVTSGANTVIATATSGTLAYSDDLGNTGYYWTVTGTVPRAYWRKLSSRYEAELRAEVDGNALVSVKEGPTDCWDNNPSVLGFYYNCLAPTSPIARLRAPLDEPAPDAHVAVISHNGSGCRPGTVTHSLTDDDTSLTIFFSDFVLEVGPGVSRRERLKNCQLVVDVESPGWRFAVAQLDQRGYAQLDEGVDFTSTVTSYLQGYVGETTTDFTLWGPMDEGYEFRDPIAISDLQFSPCGGRALNVNAAMKLNNQSTRNGGGSAGPDATDGATSLRFGLLWQRCQ